MDITEIIKDSLSFPVNNWEKLLIFGVLLTISSLSLEFTMASPNLFDNRVITIISALIFFIIGILFYIFTSGYSISIIKNSIDYDDKMPDFNIKNNFIYGLKSIALTIVYGLIIAIITFLLILVSITLMALFPTNSFSGFVVVSTITGITGLLVGIAVIFVGLFYFIANVRLADTNSLSESLDVNEIHSDIKDIGWGNYIVWFIIVGIIEIIFAVIYFIVNFAGNQIPNFGIILIILSILFISSYSNVFSNRALGLLYLSKYDD